MKITMKILIIVKNGEKKILRKHIIWNQKGELQGLLAANRRKPVIKKEKK